ncbi:hypothetical protein [Sphingomonas asaccharolytica]|uniref:hypothetical protein n=1 Tax=Sphingomonas asaccharolytica TaxID=40681 RepID=UPI0009FE9948|nr:hypothetical protein [Sphingomonas asaccharolytica]
MAQRFADVNFSKGEVAPEMYARFDVQAYSSAAKQARNVRVRKYGGLAKRLGTRFVAEVHDATKPVRLIPFQFSFEQAYALELGQGYMRPAALGGMVLEVDVAITGISSATNAVIAAAYHDYSVGDDVYLTGGDGPMGDLLNNTVWTVTSVIDDGHFAINANTTGVTFTGWTGGETRAAPPPPPPPPPPVPDPVPPPPPPPVGGGGGGHIGCVAADRTMIRLANSTHDGPGGERIARMVQVDDWVWTRDPKTGKMVAARIARVRIEREPVWSKNGLPDGTEQHRSWIDGGWKYSGEMGEVAGEADVWKAEIPGVYTFLARHIDSDTWVLSHNLKENPEPY